MKDQSNMIHAESFALNIWIFIAILENCVICAPPRPRISKIIIILGLICCCSQKTTEFEFTKDFSEFIDKHIVEDFVDFGLNKVESYVCPSF